MYLPAGACWTNAKKPDFVLWLIVKNSMLHLYIKVVGIFVLLQSWLQGALVLDCLCVIILFTDVFCPHFLTPNYILHSL